MTGRRKGMNLAGIRCRTGKRKSPRGGFRCLRTSKGRGTLGKRIQGKIPPIFLRGGKSRNPRGIHPCRRMFFGSAKKRPNLRKNPDVRFRFRVRRFAKRSGRTQSEIDPPEGNLNGVILVHPLIEGLLVPSREVPKRNRRIRLFGNQRETSGRIFRSRRTHASL